MDFLRESGESATPAHVRGLPLPTLLLDLLVSGRWLHPGDEGLREVMPWFQEPLDFLTDVRQMSRESQSLDRLADDEASSRLFRAIRGSDVAGPVELPWLDVELAVLIAVNRIPGDDVAIALDYRGNEPNPRVVASDFWTDPRQCAWRTVTPTFTEFASELNLQRGI